MIPGQLPKVSNSFGVLQGLKKKKKKRDNNRPSDRSVEREIAYTSVRVVLAE